MRTKTLLVTAALSLAAVATSMAQVYSVNAVGYVNKTLEPGFNLIANQLDRTPDNKLDTLLGGVPVESQVFKYSSNTGLYKADIYDGAAWLDAESGNPSATTVNPGEGFFFYNAKVPAGQITVTFVGQVPQGNVGMSLPAGKFSLVSSKVPQSIALNPANGFPNVLESLYITYDAVAQGYNTSLINDGSGWLNSVSGDPAVAQPAVGEGFFIFNADTVNPLVWTRTFSVN
jgi:hypothetical protein